MCSHLVKNTSGPARVQLVLEQCVSKFYWNQSFALARVLGCCNIISERKTSVHFPCGVDQGTPEILDPEDLSSLHAFGRRIVSVDNPRLCWTLRPFR